ncbi:methyltransferase domain-containing protein [Haloferax sp. MBLA0076]|uniref:Methyltransferase domain-containing protein n=1 Tax=Haloferax litoreum TaxID=2666140 RepID=A0A6A8GL67_9EURY|nr:MULTISPECIES: class I SAM-dependent methyltransferase [Haloferax]KAB1190547.1 class I SAM-dependent methyltransferase [Haloferax sp. CBA1148]MRX23531.1 methyltransferase domain-containing protein [Haloferax litoreum]
MDPEENHRGWAERSGDYSPAYYAEIGPNEVSETLATVFDHYVSTDAKILEIGCSSGRHLSHLLDHGYKNLTGIDLNDDSFEAMAEYFPELAQTGTFHTGAIEEFVPEFRDDQFDVIYSVETLQHVHPDDEWVFEELARASADLVITAENEGNSPQRGRDGAEVSYVNDDFPLFHRNWKQVFSDIGLAQLLEEPGKRDTVRVFRVL